MGDSYGVVRVAAVQAAPVVLDREATLARVGSLVEEAAQRGARIIVLPEAFVPAYPASAIFGPVFGGFTDPAADVRRQYQKLHNDLQVRMTNTPSPSLKRMYQKNLQELKTACEVLAPGSSS